MGGSSSLSSRAAGFARRDCENRSGGCPTMRKMYYITLTCRNQKRGFNSIVATTRYYYAQPLHSYASLQLTLKLGKVHIRVISLLTARGCGFTHSLNVSSPWMDSQRQHGRSLGCVMEQEYSILPPFPCSAFAYLFPTFIFTVISFCYIINPYLENRSAGSTTSRAFHKQPAIWCVIHSMVCLAKPLSI